MKGRTFLVTGSTDGIGLHTAKRLAALKANVLVHGRDALKVERAVREVVAETGNDAVEGHVADLSSISDVRRFAEEIREKHAKIDVLLNNAGVFQPSKKTTVDGLESTWAVNVVSPYLLLCRLWDRVTTRIVNVSSISAGSQIDFGNLQMEKGYSAHAAYSQSKLCMMLLTFQLAEKLRSISPVTVNCLDPGTVNTKMLRAGWGSFGIPVSQADGELYLATSPDVADVTGEYFVRNQISRPPSVARQKEVQERLWEILEQQTGEKLDLTKTSVAT